MMGVVGEPFRWIPAGCCFPERNVEGVPLARVTSRLTWGMEKSALEERVGDVEIRTPDGPTRLHDVLAEVDEPYFERRQEFEASVRDVVGTGPVQTEE